MNAMNNLSDEKDDLVIRLREYYSEGEHLFEEKHPICDEAADEIERLRQEIANLTQSGDKTSKQVAAAAGAALVKTDRESRERFYEQSVVTGTIQTPTSSLRFSLPVEWQAISPDSFSALQSVDLPLLARAIYESLELSNPMAFMGEFSLDGTVTVDSRFNFQAVATFLLIRVNDLAAQAYAPLERTLGSEISSEMVNAGVQVLRESGFLWRESSADHLLVQRLLKTALSCRSGA